MSYRIFLVDDDSHYARLAAHRLGKRKAYEVSTFSDGRAFLDALAAPDGAAPDVVLLDIMMPGMSGIAVLKQIKEHRPELPVVMISAQGVVETAIEAMKRGAYDYVTKGQDDMARLEAVLERIFEKVRMEREIDALRDEVEERYGMSQLVGESAPMQEVYRLVRKAARAPITVAVQGESGTGKELVAKAIHYNSDREQGPFVEVNCAAVPSELMESTFFGHEKGAFTDAKQQRIGKFEQADGGTIFLDEISEMSLDLQAKLLRALQNRTLQRVGGSETISFDARVICATNGDAQDMIADGRLREDLYYRLFQFPIVLPPLRERGNDILLLARHFRDAYLAGHPDLEDKTLSAEARRALADYHWPGNVRELKSAVERALLVAEGARIAPEDLMLGQAGASAAITPWDQRTGRRADEEAPPRFSVNEHPVDESPSGDGVHAASETHAAGEDEPAEGAERAGSGDEDEADESICTIEEMKRQAVARAYRLCDENATAAAEALDIGRATMYRLLDKYDLKE
jgi:DNA-binding NtrC family response regulator